MATRVALRLLTVTVLACALLALPHGAAQPAGRDGTWVWPLKPAPPVIHGFERPPSAYAAGHRGVDLSAVVGQPVLAAGPGVVAFAGQVAGRPVVSVEHADGLRTTYEPVIAAVMAGEDVGPGQPLGTVAASPGHCLPSTCLHWGLRHGETYLDPLALVGRARVRLLPLWGPLPPLPPLAPLPSRTPLPSPPDVSPQDRGPLLARS